MIRIGVVEDDPTARTLLTQYFARYQQESGEELSITVFEDGSDIAASYRQQFDILLLDIQMERMDGLTAARHIREVDSEVIIIFITSAPQFAIKGYEVDALSYLLKPLPWFAFEQEIRRSVEAAKRKQGASMLVRHGSQMLRVALSDVLYIESEKHRLTLYTLDRSYAVSGTMKELEAQLYSHGFFRSNSYYLVKGLLWVWLALGLLRMCEVREDVDYAEGIFCHF